MKASKNAIALIEVSEKLKLKPYLCPAGIPTIGWGSTMYENGVHVKLSDPTITKDRADAIMLHQLTNYEYAVIRYVKVPLNQNQFDALVDFAYNAGNDSLRTSTLLKKLNNGDYKGAAQEFDKWVYGHVDGVAVKMGGLVVRRAAEKALFIKDIA